MLVSEAKMSKLLTVFGATGAQGGSLINFVLQHPKLSKDNRLRGITRDVSKPAATDLQARGVEVVKADMSDPSSLEKAVAGSYAVFAMTNCTLPPLSPFSLHLHCCSPFSTIALIYTSPLRRLTSESLGPSIRRSRNPAGDIRSRCMCFPGRIVVDMVFSPKHHENDEREDHRHASFRLESQGRRLYPSTCHE